MSKQKSVPTILIVGASRGIGLGLVQEYLSRGYQVYATERNLAPTTPLGELTKKASGKLHIELLDINYPEQITALAKKLQGVELDILFVNAGVSDKPKGQTIGQIETQEFERVMVTNALSPLRVIETMATLVKSKGTIAVMSSRLGSVASNTDGGFETYRASKAALNMLLKSYVIRAGEARSFLALMPGWVRTDMGGPEAPVTVEESTKGLADTIKLHEGSGKLEFVDYQNQPIPW